MYHELVWPVERGLRGEPGTVRGEGWREGKGGREREERLLYALIHHSLATGVTYAHISVSLTGWDSGGGRLLSPLTHLYISWLLLASRDAVKIAVANATSKTPFPSPVRVGSQQYLCSQGVQHQITLHTSAVHLCIDTHTFLLNAADNIV